MSLNPQKGMTLVEMLVSLVAGLVVVAGGISLFTSVIVSGNTTLMLSRLNQDIQAITDIITRDIQRAGYDENAVALLNNVPPSASIYTFSTETDLWPASPALATCIRVKYRDSEEGSNIGRVYSYDADENTIKLQTSGSFSSTIDTLCGTGDSLTSNTEIRVDGLSFSIVSGSVSSGNRAIDIDISATHVNNPELSMVMERRVKIRNDGY